MRSEPRITRKEQEIEARKKDILDIAAKLFSEKDFHEVKMDDIAEQVGLSKGTIYLYFENKDKLFFSIIIERTKMLYKHIQAALQCNRAFMKCLTQFVKTFLGFFREHEAFFKIMQSEKSRMSMESQHQMHKYAMEAFQSYFKLMIELIKTGQKQQNIRNIDPLIAANGLRGILNSFIFHRIFIGSDASLEEEVDQVVDLFMNGVKLQE